MLACLTGCATVQCDSTETKLKSTTLPVLDVRGGNVREGLRTIASAAEPLGITVDYLQVEGRKVTVFVPGKSIYEAMDILCTVAGLTHRIEGNTVTVTIEKIEGRTTH
jgi:hypothetical protein